MAVAKVQDHEFPENLLYDIENQIWYERLADGTLRAGFTPWAVALMGDVLVFTPKRLGHSFEEERWFAMVEGGKWVGAARAAFNGTLVAHNEALVARPQILNSDPFGEGWMLIVKPSDDEWAAGLVSGAEIEPAMARWIAGESYKTRSG
jgi:glycine cleavage system H protein